MAALGASDEELDRMRKNTLSVMIDGTMADADGNIDATGYVDLSPNVDDNHNDAKL